MTTTPRVSIVTSTYNRSNVLRFTIESVLASTFTDWEMIIVGDACTDDTEAVVQSFGDARISFVNLPVNSGEQAKTVDRLFISYGLVRMVFYDAREDSPTHGLLNEFRFGTVRPALVNIPRRVWHGVQNTGSAQCVVLNLVDRAYDYEDPDHWRLPVGAAEIPFAF